MGRQLNFYSCSEMRTAIEKEAKRLGVFLTGQHPDEPPFIQFSVSMGTDQFHGRLWSDAGGEEFEALCRAAKRQAYIDRESGLWVKHASKLAFDAYRAERKSASEELMERNRRYAIEILGGRPTK
jgi:hypothetical protein